MKGLILLCSLALALSTSQLTAQDLAAVASQPIGLSVLNENNPPVDSPTATPVTTPITTASKQASAWLNGGNIQVETLPASSTVLVSFTLPMRDDWGTIELADAESGKLLFTGNVYIHDGQVELPVMNPAGSYEVRLSTEHDLLIARMAE